VTGARIDVVQSLTELCQGLPKCTNKSTLIYLKYKQKYIDLLKVHTKVH